MSNNNSSNITQEGKNVGVGSSSSSSLTTRTTSNSSAKSQQPIKIGKKNDFRQDDDEFSMSPKLVTRGVLSVKIPPNVNSNSNNGSPLPAYKKQTTNNSA